MDLIYEPTNKYHYLNVNNVKYYYDIAMKEDWKVNEDYTAVGEELYLYFWKYFTWERPIVR